MAWTDKYTANFSDKSEDVITIQIQQDPLVGNEEQLTLADEPLTIYVPARDLEHYIWGMGCRINLVNLGALNKYDHIFEAAERSHRVIIRKGPATTAQENRTLIFKGFITPDIHNQQMMPKPEFSLTANNQLSGLKDYYSDLLAVTGDFSTIQLIDLMQDILDSTGMELPIYIKNTLFSTLYAVSYAIADVCYDKLRINRQIYVDQDEIIDGFSILQDILKVTYSRLYYMDGKWVIDRYTDMANTTSYKTYPYPYTETPSSATLTHESFNLSDEKRIANSGNLSYQSGKKLFRMIINFDKYDNLVPSTFVHIQQSDAMPRTEKGILPKPTQNFWQTWRGLSVWRKSLITEYLTSGLAHTKGWLSVSEYYNVPVTACFVVDFTSGTDWQVRYSYDWSQVPVVTNKSYRGGFRLRYQDTNSNWRFLTFVDGVLKLNGLLSDEIAQIDYSALEASKPGGNIGKYELRWHWLSTDGYYRWRIYYNPTSIIPSGILLWESDEKEEEFGDYSPQYGSITFQSVNTTAEFTMTINDPSVDEFSLVPGRSEWIADHINEEEYMVGLYRNHLDLSENSLFALVPLDSLYTITGQEATDQPVQKISESLNYEDIQSWVNTDLGHTPEIFELYIDLMPMHRIDHPEEDNEWEPTFAENTYMGDVVVAQNNELSNNVIEGELNTDFRGELERKLMIYDGDYVNYKNTLLLTDSTDKIVLSKDWKDDNGNITDLKLQNALIHDLAQQYNTARHSIKIDLWVGDQSNIFVTLGSIFTYSTQLATKNFILMGYDYNVKKNAYKITLREHKDYDQFTIT